MSKEPFLTVYGHVSIDQILSLKEFPAVNTSVDILGKKRHLGGTGANIATISAALGTPTAISSCVGEDFPLKYREFMESHGLIMDELVTLDDEETSTALIINNERHDQITYFFQGPLGSADPEKAMTSMASRSKHVHFSTGNPHYYLKVMKDLVDSSVVTALDPAQETHRIWNRDSFSKAIEHADILFSNEHEISSMLSYLGIKEITEIPVETLVLTRGAKGSSIIIDGEVHDIPVKAANGVADTTGAGDAFRAGLYTGLYRGLDILDAAAVAAATASFVVEAKGALTFIPSLEMVMDRAAL